MGIVIQTKWQCPSCYELHDDQDEAQECCRPAAQEVYLCPKCGDACEDEDEAIACCDTDPDEVTGDDGKKFPNLGAHMSTAEYVAAYNELNKIVQ